MAKTVSDYEKIFDKFYQLFSQINRIKHGTAPIPGDTRYKPGYVLLPPISQKASLKAARARGRMGGRPPVLDTRQINRMIVMYDEQKNTVAEICKIYDISRPSFYNYLKRRKKLNAIEKLD